MGIFVVWWSLSNMVTAAAAGVRSMAAVRFSLGLGEAGVWPAASKAVSEWFPARERAFAIGLYTMGATIGATAAPYMVIPLAGFDYARQLSGTGGVARSRAPAGDGVHPDGAWPASCGSCRGCCSIGSPKAAPSSAEKERQLDPIPTAPRKDRGTASLDLETGDELPGSLWLLLVRTPVDRSGLVFLSILVPQVPHQARGLSQGELTITWVVYAAAAAGSLLGGWLSGHLIKRGMRPVKSRRIVMAGCALLVPLSPLIASVSGLAFSMTLTVLVVFASLAWLINISTLVNDLIPRHSLGTAFSVIAAGSTIGGIVMNTLVGAMVSGPSTKPLGFLDQALRVPLGGALDLVQGRGYALAFILMAFVHPLALLVVWLGGFHRRKTV